MIRPIFAIVIPLLLGGCIVADVAETAVEVASIPVRVVSAGVDAATTSQSEADEKRGREIRKTDEARARQARELEERCRKGKPLPEDDCGAVQPD